MFLRQSTSKLSQLLAHGPSPLVHRWCLSVLGVAAVAALVQK
jgi:hypothetical protein